MAVLAPGQFAGVSPTEGASIFSQPIRQPGLPGRRTVHPKQAIHEAFDFAPVLESRQSFLLWAKIVLAFCYMATLLIRDLPDEIEARLGQMAKLARRSKEKQAMVLLEEAIGRPPKPDNTLAEARKLRAQCKRPVTMTEILAATEAEH